jgi:CheY-like chemotaxis protein
MVDQGVVQAQTKRLLRILIVDDNQDAADSLFLLLRHWGYDCQVAYNGSAALDLAQSYWPQCLLLDIRMPGLDGCQVARLLRCQPGLNEIKLVALTAYSDSHHLRRIWEAGFDFHLTKPADPVELEKILEMLNDWLLITQEEQEWARKKAPGEGTE